MASSSFNLFKKVENIQNCQKSANFLMLYVVKFLCFGQFIRWVIGRVTHYYDCLSLFLHYTFMNNSCICRSNQPRLGIGHSTAPNTYLFEDDPGIMSEIETSSTRKSSHHHHRPPPAASSGAALRTAPRTSPASRSSYTGGYR